MTFRKLVFQTFRGDFTPVENSVLDGIACHDNQVIATENQVKSMIEYNCRSLDGNNWITDEIENMEFWAKRILIKG